MHQDPHFFILYSARHHRCCQFVERADYRVISKEDLFAWSQEVAARGSVEALSLHCDACAEDFSPTHLCILEDTDPMGRTVVPEMEIEKFNPSDWLLKSR